MANWCYVLFLALRCLSIINVVDLLIIFLHCSFCSLGSGDWRPSGSMADVDGDANQRCALILALRMDLVWACVDCD